MKSYKDNQKIRKTFILIKVLHFLFQETQGRHQLKADCILGEIQTKVSPQAEERTEELLLRTINEIHYAILTNKIVDSRKTL